LSARLVFDAEHYKRLNAARGAVVREILAELRGSLTLETAIDVGCGVGYFSELLRSQGLSVVGIDGRAENVAEAGQRYTGILFREVNAEDPKLAMLGSFDVCFCFGLLYHLENPFLAVRNLRALTKKVLLVEAVTFPGRDPVMALIDEEVHEDQGLRHFAFYPTEACLIKMFYRSGFPYVYELISQPAHPEYHESAAGRRTRTMLAASLIPIETGKLRLAPEPVSEIRPWDPASGVSGSETVIKLREFAGKSFAKKIETLKRVVSKSNQK
jgi:SAM-dependent methyltransferase